MKHSQNNRVRDEYNRLAENYDKRWMRYVDATTRATLDSLELAGCERILDVPCGTGELTGRLLEKWPLLRIAGVDLSPRMLEQAAAKHVESQVDLHEACVTGLPFPDGEFDYVFCINSFHYFPEPQSSLLEIHRVIREGGRLILVDWCDDYLVCKLCSLWLSLVDPAFHHTYTQRDCETLIRDAGFRLKDSSRFRLDWVWGMMRIETRKG